MCGLSLFAAYRAEKLGSPVFPCYPHLPLIYPKTPVEPPPLVSAQFRCCPNLFKN